MWYRGLKKRNILAMCLYRKEATEERKGKKQNWAL